VTGLPVSRGHATFPSFIGNPLTTRVPGVSSAERPMQNPSLALDRCLDVVRNAVTHRWVGRVSRIAGLVIESIGPAASIGEVCEVRRRAAGRTLLAEVVGFRDRFTLLMPLGKADGVAPRDEVIATRQALQVKLSEQMLGRVLNGLGDPVDGLGPLPCGLARPVWAEPISPLQRQRIVEPLATGIRVIDSVVTCGKGQRVGIFSGSGVGKSVLLGEIAQNTRADVNVIALIGERGREVRDFLENHLQKEGLRRSVVVAATSDQPALVRARGALVATTIAEYFRDLGRDVLLMMDSVTRFANALREIGLAAGEPPATKGYTPSVFAALPQLTERAGRIRRGSITGLYTVLVDGDDVNEPVSDAMRSILDGHILLSRALAARGHYPAVDIHDSISRVMRDVVSHEHQAAAQCLKRVAYDYREAEDMINIGAYQRGSNQQIDYAIQKMDEIRTFLCQPLGKAGSYDRDVQTMIEMFADMDSAAPASEPADEAPAEPATPLAAAVGNPGPANASVG